MKITNEHTFVICAYKESPYLEECVQSLLKQTVTSKIIIYTSTPNQAIQYIADKYSLEVFTKKGGSIGKDWNNARSFVETKYMTIAHQDDLYEPKYLENIISSFESHKDTLIVFSDYGELTEQGYRLNSTNLKIKRLMLNTMMIAPKFRNWRRFILGFGNPICCPAVSYNLDLLNDFQFNEQMKVSLDWYAWYDIANRKGRFQFIPEILMFHRIHEESETTNMIEDHTRTREDLEMYELFWPKPIAKLINNFYKNSQNSNKM